MHTTYHAPHGRTAILTALDTVEIDDMWGTTETVAVLTIGDEMREMRVLDMTPEDLTCEDADGIEHYFWR